MNRRAFLMTIGAALIPKIIRVPRTPAITWNDIVRSDVSFWKPHPAQIAFISNPINRGEWLYGAGAGGGKSLINDISNLIQVLESHKKGPR